MTVRDELIKLCELGHTLSRVCFREHGRSAPIRIRNTWYCVTCKEIFYINIEQILKKSVTKLEVKQLV